MENHVSIDIAYVIVNSNANICLYAFVLKQQTPDKCLLANKLRVFNARQFCLRMFCRQSVAQNRKWRLNVENNP